MPDVDFGALYLRDAPRRGLFPDQHKKKIWSI
jgi:hypothetical protein